MNRHLAVSLSFLAVACASTHVPVGDPSASKAQFDLLCSLEGRWTSVMENDGQRQESETEFHVTGAGSAVQEILAKGTSHEMISMYHLDGGRLMHTHYCAAGNQPRMVAVDRGSHGEIAFEFLDATNMPSPDAMHMHQMRMLVRDADQVEEWWQGYKDGALAHEAHFVLTRKK